MHLTQETDYAMRIVFCLAKNGRRMDAASISEAMCVTLRFSLKILGKLAGAGLDVTTPEPLSPDHPLWREPRIAITPHVSGHFHLAETQNRIISIACENLRAMETGGALRSEVKFSAGY